MNDITLLLAALEGHGITVRVVNGRLKLEADDRKVEHEPLELLDELTRSKAAVIEFLRTRETPPATPRVVDNRERHESAAPVAVPSAPASTPNEPRRCQWFPADEPHAHDALDGRCLTPEGWQRSMPGDWTSPVLGPVGAWPQKSASEQALDIAHRLAGRQCR